MNETTQRYVQIGAWAIILAISFYIIVITAIDVNDAKDIPSIFDERAPDAIAAIEDDYDIAKLFGPILGVVCVVLTAFYLWRQVPNRLLAGITALLIFVLLFTWLAIVEDTNRFSTALDEIYAAEDEIADVYVFQEELAVAIGLSDSPVQPSEPVMELLPAMENPGVQLMMGMFQKQTEDGLFAYGDIAEDDIFSFMTLSVILFVLYYGLLVIIGATIVGLSINQLLAARKDT